VGQLHEWEKIVPSTELMRGYRTARDEGVPHRVIVTYLTMTGSFIDLMQRLSRGRQPVASIERRTTSAKVTDQARWRDPDETQRKRTFRKKSDAERFPTTVEASKLTGSYVNHSDKTTVAEYARGWAAARPLLPTYTQVSWTSARVLARTCSSPHVGSLRTQGTSDST
jgi:hypothetical protein